MTGSQLVQTIEQAARERGVSPACPCGRPISAKASMCRSCNAKRVNADPQRRAKASASMKQRLADPHERRCHVERATAGLRAAMRDPAFVERRREIGRQYGTQNLAKTRTETSRLKAGRAISMAARGWVPFDLRATHRRFVKLYGKATADQAIRDQIETDQRRARARVEQSMERLS